MNALKIGTRGSDLALAQTQILRNTLSSSHPDLPIEIAVIRTRGDAQLDAPLGPSSPLDKGAFTKELEAALLRREIHAAVHSLKDLPTENPAGLLLAAILPRASTNDILISKQPGGLAALPQNGRVATSSPRRSAQIRKHRPDLSVEGIRGNVPTRVRKLAETDGLHAIVLAEAGLERLQLLLPGGLCKQLGLHTQVLEDFLPAPGQGAIAVQAREDDAETRLLLTSVHDPTTAECVHAERLLLAKLGGGCHLALGARAQILQNAVHLKAIWFEGPATSSCSAEAAAPTAEEVAALVFSALSSRSLRE